MNNYKGMNNFGITVEAAQLEVPRRPWIELCLVFSSFELAEKFYAHVATPDLQQENRDQVDLGSVLRSPFIKDPVSPVHFFCGRKTSDDRIGGYCILWMSDSTFESTCGEYVDVPGAGELPRMSPGFLKTVQALVALGYAIDPEMGCMFEREWLMLLWPSKWTLFGRFLTHRGMQKFMPGLVVESNKAASQPIADFIKDFLQAHG